MSEQQDLIEKKELKAGTSNESRYMKCSAPFETQIDAEKAITSFIDGIEELRERYGIANVAFAIKDSALDVGVFLVDGFYGNSLEHEALLAWAFGKAQAEREQQIMELLGKGKKSGKK